MKTVKILSILLFIGCFTITAQSKIDTLKPITKIAFGSCSSQGSSLPIFDVIVKHKPDLFIFLGDNIYGDSKEKEVLKAKYERMAKKPTYQNLKKNVPIIATWDDHDYGWNDSGKEYPLKEESKELFLDFFEEPANSSRRKHKGIYHSYYYNYHQQILQIILLDVRTFRDALKKYNGEFDYDKRYRFYSKDYAKHIDTTATLLGKEQWDWLASELKKPADVRIIGTGTQFGIEWNGYESWVNFPHEQKRMLNLIKKNKVNGLFFISGDVHYSEISKLNTDFYPIYDFTSSGLSSTWHFATPNKNRIEGPVMENHFGIIEIDWKDKQTSLNMQTWDVTNNQRFQYSVRLQDLQFVD